MKRLPVLLLFACACLVLRAQSPAAPADSPSAVVIGPAGSLDWITDIDEGWRVHDGDNSAYAQPGFNDSSWQSVELDNLDSAEAGWRWYRLHLRLPADHPQLALLIEGGEGTYELYLNGVAVPSAQILSSLRVNRPTERTFPLNTSGPDLEIALRTHIPPIYAGAHLPQFMTASLGTPQAIENQRVSMQSIRMYAAFPAIGINILLMLGGIGAFALRRSQPAHPEYMWLGLYLFLTGLSAFLWGCQINGILPVSANFLFADPVVYAFTIAQIEFTYSFGGRRVGRAWRVYEAILLSPIALIWFTWHGLMPIAIYLFIQALIVIPAALLLPVLLLIWFRQGNREAGWLILPSLLPSAFVTLNGFGNVSIYLGWRHLDFLVDFIQIGAAQIMPNDASSLLFLLAVAVVMYFRFTRVSREQARAAAELDAAREIQQRLVPASLPAIPGFQLGAAYLPAQEVGGDFYQVLEQKNGSILVIVGDVSGKGLKAAMTGALAMGTLRALAAENLQPAALLERTNLQMIEANNGGFITCICMRLAADGTTTLANAGHLSPYCNGQEIPLEPALPLGLSPDVDYAEHTMQLNHGDALTLLSDGVIEATNSTGELFGFERTRSISSQPARSIARAAQQFGQEDDITVLTVART